MNSGFKKEVFKLLCFYQIEFAQNIVCKPSLTSRCGICRVVCLVSKVSIIPVQYLHYPIYLYSIHTISVQYLQYPHYTSIHNLLPPRILLAPLGRGRGLATIICLTYINCNPTDFFIKKIYKCTQQASILLQAIVLLLCNMSVSRLSQV